MTMAINRLDQAGIERELGTAAADLLLKRIRGGEAGHKGVRFEHFFAAHRVARLAKNYLANGEDATVEWQAHAFVDDVVVRRDARTSFKGYQLKNSANVSWTAGDHPIQDDFILQKRMCDAEGYTDVRLRLVCADQDMAATLKANMPDQLSTFGGAFRFPYAPVVLPVLLGNDWLVEDFGYLSRAGRPTAIEAQQIAALLIGAVAVLGNKAEVSTIIAKVREVSPTLLRALGSDDDARAQLLPEMVTLMDGWSDFTYGIIKGFLTWAAFGGTTSGTLSFDCFDPKFAKWQQTIIATKPQNFEDVEGVFT